MGVFVINMICKGRGMHKWAEFCSSGFSTDTSPNGRPLGTIEDMKNPDRRNAMAELCDIAGLVDSGKCTKGYQYASVKTSLLSTPTQECKEW